MLKNEIHGFSYPSEYSKFVKFLEEQITTGNIEEISVDYSYDKDCIVGGRWFKNIKNQEIWRLVEPDFPFKGLWELVGKI